LKITKFIRKVHQNKLSINIQYLKFRKRIQESGLFDESYYVDNNHDVSETRFHPLKHYLRYGGFEGRNPGPKFNSLFYLTQYPDVKYSGLNPLIHYLQYGKKENRKIYPDQWSGNQTKNGINKFTFESDEDHGQNLLLLRRSRLFDSDYYVDSNQDLIDSGIDPLEHYYFNGWKEGRCPNQRFELNVTTLLYNDFIINDINPLIYCIKQVLLTCYQSSTSNNNDSSFSIFENIENFNENPKIFENQVLELWDKLKNSHEALKGDLFLLDENLLYQQWKELRNPDKETLYNQRNKSKVLTSPNSIKILLISSGNLESLSLTLQSIVKQSYTHWECYIIYQRKLNENNDIDKIISLVTKLYPGNTFIIHNPIDFFEMITHKQEYIGFMTEGEVLREDGFWELMVNPSDLIYSDHDSFSSDKSYNNHWLTFGWSPDLLLSNDYVGGFYLVSSLLFFETFGTRYINEIVQDFTQSPAWRYGILLRLGNKAKDVSRIPKVLWTGKHLSPEEKSELFEDELLQAEKYLKNIDINTDIVEIDSTGIRKTNYHLSTSPKVSIIIPTTGNIVYLKTCINSILSVTEYNNYEIIILDNGRGNHRDGIQYAIDSGAKVIEVNEPFNWSKLNNMGSQNSDGELLLFLNDDIEIVSKSWLKEMIKQASREEIGVVGSLLLYLDGRIQHAGVFLVDHGGGARHIFHKQEPGNNIYHSLDLCTREVTAVTGACMMVRRELFIKLGQFDESLSMVGNDIDLCLKSIEAGHRNIWTPHSKLIHHESVSRKNKPIEKDEKSMWDRWEHKFSEGDYYYNPNLTLIKEDCSLKDIIKLTNLKSRNKTTANLLTSKFNSVKANSKESTTFGLNLIAYIRAEMGVGEAARGNASAMEAVDIPFGIINFEMGNPAIMGNLLFQHKEMLIPKFDINVVHVNADQTPFLYQSLGMEYFKNKYNIGYWAWELPEFPDKWLETFNLVDEIWVPSEFVNSAISAKSPVPVVTIPHVVKIDESELTKFNREHFGIPSNAFIFLNMFDSNSVIERKNPFGAIKAFKDAFSSSDKEVILLVKVSNANKSALKELKNEIDNYKNIILIDKHYSRVELNSLIAGIDCYVSLHRSEGFGLVPAEAMALGKVVIITDWSGNKQYMTADNCIPISYNLKSIGRKMGPYDADQYWAEPNLEEASNQMKRIASDKVLYNKIGSAARYHISTEFSAEKIGALMKSRIKVIYNNLNRT
jgi:GT2 family glycosyltransferase